MLCQHPVLATFQILLIAGDSPCYFHPASFSSLHPTSFSFLDPPSLSSQYIHQYTFKYPLNLLGYPYSNPPSHRMRPTYPNFID